MPQKPAAWALHASDGTVAWSEAVSAPSYASTTAVPGIAFMGSLFGKVVAHDAGSGMVRRGLQVGGLLASVSSSATVVDGEIFVGAGTGARGGSPAEAAFQASIVPSPITALCLADAADCPAQLCDDGDPCTYDFHAGAGCESEPGPDGLPCTVAGHTGRCRSGLCQAAQ
jgi:hypothetical protein